VAMGRRVLVSRGELVEIGGGFRVPEVMARSGAQLVEVGTTNKTRVADYARELERGDVAAVLRVHQGNFRQEGFVARPPLAELAELAQKAGVPLLEDLGGGALVDFAAHGLAGEPTVQASVEAGVDLVCFSTDKLLGGPQGGAVVGRSGLVERARRDPFARAVRMGRLPLVALEATLEAYLAREPRRLPALDALLRPLPEVRARAEAWVTALAAEGVASEAVPLEAEVGGGALAGVPLASVGVALASSRPDALARALRRGDPAVLARVHAGQLVLDARTVLPGDDEALVGAVARAARGS
jgi:L-seryl-tRNA(Ser) seleniumtransferase